MSDETLDRSAERYAERFSRYNLVAVVNNLDNAQRVAQHAESSGYRSN